MISQLRTQLVAVLRLEVRKALFSRRGWWVYLLAIAPVLLYVGNSIYAPRERARLSSLAAAHPGSGAALRALKQGDNRDDVLRRLGEPYSTRIDHRRFGGTRTAEIAFYRYTDGQDDYRLVFFDNNLRRIEHDNPGNLSADSLIFATIFQYFYLRLAIFFGCVGIFTNLFRGELLDKSLHFYLLAPVRREVLLMGKFLAGLIATVVIFTTSAALQFLAMLWQYDSGAVSAYMSAHGWADFGAYVAVAALACVGYGGIFLVAGLVFRNPITPAAMVLLWESANLFLPATLKHISVIYYLQSLCPVVPPVDSSMPAALAALVSAFQPTSRTVAIGGIVLVTLLMLWAASVRARKLESTTAPNNALRGFNSGDRNAPNALTLPFRLKLIASC